MYLTGRGMRASPHADSAAILSTTLQLNPLSIFGLFAVGMMLVCYALERRAHGFVLAFAVACLLASAYGFLQGAWPFGLVEGVWFVVALRRWWNSSTERHG